MSPFMLRFQASWLMNQQPEVNYAALKHEFLKLAESTREVTDHLLIMEVRTSFMQADMRRNSRTTPEMTLKISKRGRLTVLPKRC